MNDDWQSKRLTEAELKTFFDRLFPNGFAGADALAEIAPDSWEKSPLLACIHPSPEQVFEETVQMHRNVEEFTRRRREREPDNPKLTPRPEPTLEEIRAQWKDEPVNTTDEVTRLVGLCLWDVFSDNHEVIAADGRIVDLGSFRGSAGFIAEYLHGPNEDIFNMDYCEFYLGTIWIARRADLTPVYRMIFRRIKSVGGNWEYHFPEIGVVDLRPIKEAMEAEKKPEDYSPSDAFAKEQEDREHDEEVERLRADLAEGNAAARREALDRPPPTTVLAYQEIFGCEPKGWPPE